MTNEAGKAPGDFHGQPDSIYARIAAIWVRHLNEPVLWGHLCGEVALFWTHGFTLQLLGTMLEIESNFSPEKFVHKAQSLTLGSGLGSLLLHMYLVTNKAMQDMKGWRNEMSGDMIKQVFYHRFNSAGKADISE